MCGCIAGATSTGHVADSAVAVVRSSARPWARRASLTSEVLFRQPRGWIGKWPGGLGVGMARLAHRLASASITPGPLRDQRGALRARSWTRNPAVFRLEKAPRLARPLARVVDANSRRARDHAARAPNT